MKTKKSYKVDLSAFLNKKDGSKITDPWKVVDDHKRHKCVKCRKEKAVEKFAICTSKYNPKLSKTCKSCNDYRKKTR